MKENGRLNITLAHDSTYVTTEITDNGEGIDKKEFGISVKTQIAVEIIIGTLIHFISQQLASRRKILSDQLAEEIIEVLFKGLNE